MEVRHITPEESIDAMKIMSVAFQSSFDFSTVHEQPEDFQKKAWWRDGNNLIATFEDGQMTAVLEAIPYQVNYHSHTVGMTGIACVASLPEFRRKGAVRAAMAQMMQESYASGVVFSYLYPFSFPYYRQFGYELGYMAGRLDLPMAQLKCFPKEGRLEMLQKDADPALLRNLYTQFIKGRNLAVVRDEANWKNWMEDDPYASQRFCYVWYDNENATEPAAYIRWRRIEENGKKHMLVQDFALRDEHQWPQVLGSLYTWSAQFEAIRFQTLPLDCPLYLLFSDQYRTNVTSSARGMNRVLNAQAALKLYPWHSNAPTGRFVMRIHDDFLPVNEANLSIFWDGAHTDIQITTDAPHLELHTQQLSQLLTNAYALEALHLHPNVRIDGQQHLLYQLFPKGKVFLADDF